VKGRSRVGGPRIEGDRSAQGPGWRESAIQRSRHRPKRCSDRGTGAVTATGSHEGLPDDGRHPGSSTGRLGHARRPRVVLAFQRTLRPVFRGQKPTARTASSPREGMGGVRVNEGARQGCQRLDRKSAPWEETPTLMTEAARCSSWGTASPAIRRSGLGRRETSGPRSCRAEPKTPWGIPAAKAARVNREHTRCGCTYLEWVAEIDRTHRASSAPGGRKASW